MSPLELIGLLFLSVLAYRILRSLISFIYYFLATRLNSGINITSTSKWAVITGATDGLGKAFAFELASRGMDVVLISRTKDKLSAVASEIEAKHKVNTKIIEADFTKDDEVYKHIEQELFGLGIGVLINNVGMSYPYPEYFLDLPEKQLLYKNMVKCNIWSMLQMCQIVMPMMVEQNNGVVINISSTAGDIPSPLLCVYAASKVFVSKFSKDLGAEYKKNGITVQCLIPGYVATKMSKIRKPSWMAPSPEVYVKCALQTVGVYRHTTGYYPHNILLYTILLMESLSPRIAEWLVIRTMENIRSRSLKKTSQPSH